MAKTLAEMIASGEAVAEEETTTASLREMLARGEAVLDDGPVEETAEQRAAKRFNLDSLSDQNPGELGILKKRNPLMPSQREAASKALSSSMGGIQGMALDWGDEGRAMQGTGLGMLARVASSPLETLSSPIETAKEVLPLYRALRAHERKSFAAAEDLNPTTFSGSSLATALATPIPGASVTKAKTLAGRLAKGTGIGAAIGAGVGSGASTADLTKLLDGEEGEGIAELKQFGQDVGLTTGIGGLFGLAGSAGGAVLDRLRGRARVGVDKAVSDQTAIETRAKEKAVASASGTLGGESAATLRTREKLLEIAADAAESPEIREQAQARLADPRFAEAVSKARAEYIRKAPEQLARLDAAAESLKQAAAIDVAKATEASLANPLKTQVLPRVKTYANRMIPIALGTTVGGIPGAVAGGLAANTMGRPTTALAKAVQSPAVRKMGWESLETLIGREAPPNASNMLRFPLQQALERYGTQNTPAEYMRKVAAQRTPEEEEREAILALLRGAPSP